MAPSNAHAISYGSGQLSLYGPSSMRYLPICRSFRVPLVYSNVSSDRHDRGQDRLIGNRQASWYLGKRYTMSYDARSFPHHEWKTHLSWGVLKDHLKHSEKETSAASVPPSTQNCEKGQLTPAEDVGLQGQENRVSEGSEPGASTMPQA